MKKTILFIIGILLTFYLKAQTDTVEIIFDGFYEIREGHNEEKYYSILFDSAYYHKENFEFIRVLTLGNKSDLTESLISGQTYSVVIQRKLQYSCGCGNELINIRSNRTMTDEGTLFGSNFLEKQKAIASKSSCDYKVIEYYFVLEINRNGGY